MPLPLFGSEMLMQDMPVEQWIPRAVLPFGYALLAFRFVQVLLRVARGQDVSLLGDEAKDALKLQDPGTKTGARP